MLGSHRLIFFLVLRLACVGLFRERGSDKPEQLNNGCVAAVPVRRSERRLRPNTGITEYGSTLDLA
jgi:hypothetical protein